MKKRIFLTVFLAAIIGAGAVSAYIFRDEIKGFFHPHKHAYELTEEIPATCDADGKKTYACDCGETREETIPATGHTEEIVPGYDATCKGPGLTDGVKCIVCEEILTAQEEIPQLEHKTEFIYGYDATCKGPGLTDGVKCIVCEEILTAQEEIPALSATEGHNLVDGFCTNCNYFFPREVYGCGYSLRGIEIGEDLAGKTLKLGRVGDNSMAISVGYLREGNLVRVPTAICNDRAVYGSVNANGQTVDLGNFYVWEGYNYIIFHNGLDIIANYINSAWIVERGEEHLSATVPGYAATCKGPGLTDGVKCIVCEEILTAQEEIPATGHDFIDGFCTNCGVATVSSLWTTPTSDGYTVDGNKLTFSGTNELTFATKQQYSSVTLTFNVSETQDVRGAFQVGWGAQSQNTSINDLPFVQFNYDRAVLCLPDGTTYDTSWLTGKSWKLTIDAENNKVILSVDGEVVYNVDTSWWTQAGWGLPGYLILRAESNCALTFELTQINPTV